MLQGWFCPSGPTHNFPLRSPNLISGWRIDPNWKCNQENRSDLLNHFYGITSLGLGRLWSLFSRKDQVQVRSRVIGVRFKVKLQIFYDLLSLKLSVQVMWLKSTPLTHLKTQTLTSGASSLESWLRTKSLKYYFILVTPPKYHIHSLCSSPTWSQTVCKHLSAKWFLRKCDVTVPSDRAFRQFVFMQEKTGGERAS